MSQILLDASDCMIIGYYPIRGKAQICRLLCEYLHLPYRDLLFTPKTWQDFKQKQNLNWTFEQLPFLIDGQTIVTQTYPICLYLLYKANKQSLLGTSLLQQIRIDAQIWKTEPASYLFTALVNHRDYTLDVKIQATNKLWDKVLKQKLAKLENQSQNTYFFQYLTILDFYIYEMVIFINALCPQKLQEYPKLCKIHNNVAAIPQIKAYAQSKRSIKQVCPIKFCIIWRQRCATKAN